MGGVGGRRGWEAWQLACRRLWERYEASSFTIVLIWEQAVHTVQPNSSVSAVRCGSCIGIQGALREGVVQRQSTA